MSVSRIAQALRTTLIVVEKKTNTNFGDSPSVQPYLVERDLYFAASVRRVIVMVSQNQERRDELASAILNVIELVVMRRRGGCQNSNWLLCDCPLELL